MRALWTLTKVALALAIGIPLAIITLSMTLGILGAVVALAVLVLRVAIVGFIIWAAFRLAMRMFGAGRPAPKPKAAALTEPVDPYLELAKRELDRDLGVR